MIGLVEGSALLELVTVLGVQVVDVALWLPEAPTLDGLLPYLFRDLDVRVVPVHELRVILLGVQHLEVSQVVEFIFVFDPLLLLSTQVLLLGRDLLLPCQHSLLQLCSLLRNIFVFSFPAQVEDVDGILDELLLDGIVKRGVSGEAGRLVDLDEPRLAVLVYKHVKAQDLKAQRVLEIICFA